MTTDGGCGARQAALREGAAAVSGRRGGREAQRTAAAARDRRRYVKGRRPPMMGLNRPNGPGSGPVPYEHSIQLHHHGSIIIPIDGITDSACKNQLIMDSVQHGPFNTYIPIRSTTIGKSRVARDPITMHTSRSSNSDIACVTRRSPIVSRCFSNNGPGKGFVSGSAMLSAEGTLSTVIVGAVLDPDPVSRGRSGSAWLQPNSQGIWLFKVGGARSSLIRPMTGSTSPSSVCSRRADEFLPRTEFPQKGDRNKSDHGGGGTAARRWKRRPRGF
ncbi:zinc transporter 8-like [Dorcoceras hygrometricum]|uniref:Zinc transporter 8-like n=1 Tax=Dorcoceras hygrometricum TaxID=472368 RepID=A0A2Z7B2P5_9LAMI|nr:zinc transporter 8-like [Dorcoceras hygrometricum]